MAWSFGDKDYRIVERADQIRFILPRRSIPLIHIQLFFACLQTLAPLFPAGFITVVIFWQGRSGPHGPGHTQVSGAWVVILCLWAFGLLLSCFALALHVRRLGRTEVRLSKGGLESRESLGPVRFRRTRNLQSLLRLDVDAPSKTASKTPADLQTATGAEDEPASLLAHFSDQKPLILARLFPRPMLERLAKDVVRASARFGSGQKVLFDSPPPPVVAPTQAAVIKPLVVTPAPRGSKMDASEIARGGVRITIRRNLPVAVACGVFLSLALFALLSMLTGNIAWIRLIAPQVQQGDLIGSIIISAWATVLLFVVLVRAMATRIFEADQAALSRATEGPLGRHSKRWARGEIAGIDPIAKTYSNRGRSHVEHTLELRLKAGQNVKLVGNSTKAEMEWMSDLLSAALRIPRP
jgi:hypothetical protein